MINETDALLRNWWARDAQLKREIARRSLCVELIMLVAVAAFCGFAVIIT